MIRLCRLLLAASVALWGCDNSAFVGSGSDGGASNDGGATGQSGLSTSAYLSDLGTAQLVAFCDWVGSLDDGSSGDDTGCPSNVGCMSPPDAKCIQRVAPINALRSRAACIDQLSGLASRMQCRIQVGSVEACAKAVSLLPSCSVPDNVPECAPSKVCSGGVFGYEPLAPQTRAAATIGADQGSATFDAYQLSLSDAAPSQACHLASDINASPASAASQIVITLLEYGGLTAQTFCPVDSYVIRSDCPPTHDYARSGFAFGPERCAYYRRFEGGELVGTAPATGGVVKVTATATHCRFSVQLQFDGGAQFSDTFDLPIGETSCTPSN